MRNKNFVIVDWLIYSSLNASIGLILVALNAGISPINVPKIIQPKGLYLVRPSMQQYLSTREELNEASEIMFEKISSGKVKIKIYKKYKLDEIVQAHQDLEGRKILGPAVIIPS